jgi:hypothetical protein
VTDYQSLIARAVEGVASDKGETRRALYERARTALVTQLRAVDPPLSESVIAKERLALESAIREVEDDAARSTSGWRASLSRHTPAIHSFGRPPRNHGIGAV